MSQPATPTKCRPEVSEAKSARRTRSQADGEQEAVGSHAESPSEECKSCGKKFKMLLSHLKRSDTCAAQYDMPAMEAEQRTRQIERKRAYNEEHREQINASMKDNYLKHTTEKRAASRDRYYQCRSWSHVCSVCEKTFWTQKALDYHYEHLHKNNYPSITCQICDGKFAAKETLERHMKEVHGEKKHHCEKCPAAYTRKGELEKHLDEGWHYFSFYCKQCKKTLVFKHLKGLIDHVIVKQSEGEQESGEYKWKIHKSGMLVTCKSQVESTQMEEGEHVLCMPKEDKVKAYAKRKMIKEEIINEGLKLVKENPENVCVKLTLEYQKHEVDDGKRSCKWCKNLYSVLQNFAHVENPLKTG